MNNIHNLEIITKDRVTLIGTSLTGKKSETIDLEKMDSQVMEHEIRGRDF